MIDLNKPVQTRDGCPVYIVPEAKGRCPFPLLGLFKKGDHWHMGNWTDQGEYIYNLSEPHPLDLVNVLDVIEHTIYANVYKDQVNVYFTRDLADVRARDDRFACLELKLKATRGEGL